MCPSDSKKDDDNIKRIAIESDTFQDHGDENLRLRTRIATLEQELASYGSKYGFTKLARELLANPAQH